VTAESGTRFFDTADEALAAGVEIDADPFEYALALCGHTLAGAAAALPELAPEGPREGWDRTRIVTVTHGHRGASCSNSSYWMYLLRGDARARFWSDEASYRRNREGESLWYGTARAFLQPYANFTPFAVDAMRLLPPTMPDGRSEDRLFGVLIAGGDPASLAFHTNLTIGHRQEGSRLRTASLFEPVMPTFNLFLADLVSETEHQAERDPARRLATFAARMRAAAAAGLGDQLASRTERLREELVRRLEAAIADAPGAPDYWRADVDRMLEVTRRSLAAPPPLRLPDSSDTFDDTGADRARRRLEAFAATLEAWPALWEYAAGHAEDVLGEAATRSRRPAGGGA
jgi:hypothetical protein